jgi:hypothetical protein
MMTMGLPKDEEFYVYKKKEREIEKGSKGESAKVNKKTRKREKEAQGKGSRDLF